MTTERQVFERAYDREMFRSSVFSALWALIADRKKKSGFKLGDLADTLGKDKGYVSRLFSRRENCKLNTISDVAHALDADIRFEIVDRKSGERFAPSGIVSRGRETHHVLRQEIELSEGEASHMTKTRWTTRRVVG